MLVKPRRNDKCLGKQTVTSVAGRALLGICIGGFWALATAVIMRLVQAEDVPRALALVYGGQAIAAAFAALVGSYLGSLIGWREVFWALTPIVAINLVWHAVALPSLPAPQSIYQSAPCQAPRWMSSQSFRTLEKAGRW